MSQRILNHRLISNELSALSSTLAQQSDLGVSLNTICSLWSPLHTHTDTQCSLSYHSARANKEDCNEAMQFRRTRVDEILYLVLT